MKEVDYIVVGFGLAGMAFCEQLERNGHSFVVIDKQTEAASRVAAGLINPVILKRYTMPWQGEEQFDLAKAFFKRLQSRLEVEAIQEIPVYKLFASVEDQNNWFEASDKPVLSRFLDAALKTDVSLAVNAQLHCGEVKETIRIHISKLLDAYQVKLQEKGRYLNESFEHDALVFDSETAITYQTLKAKRILFAEGFGIKKNPFFNKLPLVGNKGEYITIAAPDLQMTKALKSSFFIIPLGDDLYKVGATFNWQEKDCFTTSAAREELVEKLEAVINCDYKIVDQEAAVRPTTGDRRPLLGVHPEYSQLALLNGLGTRGTMMAPYLAEQLYKHLEYNEPLDSDAQILRFPKKF